MIAQRGEKGEARGKNKSYAAEWIDKNTSFAFVSQKIGNLSKRKCCKSRSWWLKDVLILWLNHEAARLPLRSWIREAHIPGTLKKTSENWSADLSKPSTRLPTFMVCEYIFLYNPTNHALAQLFLNILASSRATLCIYSYSQKFRSETLNIPICWLGYAGNNAETECLGCEELSQSGIIQWTENVLKHNQLQKAKTSPDCTTAGTKTERVCSLTTWLLFS